MRHAAQDPFRLAIKVAKNRRRIGLDSTVISIGSCFSEVVGRRLRDRHFRVVLNPTGTVYNPLAIAHALRRIAAGRTYRTSELFQFRGAWRSFDHSTAFNATSSRACLRGINGHLAEAHAACGKLDVLIITLGTAYAWFLKQNDRLVSNCHTVPQVHFDRRLMPPAVIAEQLAGLLEEFYERRPDLNVILTVSPVRYLRSDAHSNSLSKAHLMTAVGELEQRFPTLYYFPAYELVLDELRDYRFFGRDRAHLSEEAEEYVWQRFIEACLDKRAGEFLAAVEPIIRATEHRIRDGGGEETVRFARGQYAAVRAVEKEFPEVKLERERAHFGRLARPARGS
jgi:hypothetical protein